MFAFEVGQVVTRVRQTGVNGTSADNDTDADRVIEGHRMSPALIADARRSTPRRSASDRAALEYLALCGAVPISVIERVEDAPITELLRKTERIADGVSR